MVDHHWHCCLETIANRMRSMCIINRLPSMVCCVGVEQVKMDMAKNQVTVTGTMDAKALPEKLHKKLRRPVDVVPAKEVKDKDGKQQDGGGKDKDAATKKLTAELEAWKAAFYDQQSLTSDQRRVHAQRREPKRLRGHVIAALFDRSEGNGFCR